MFRKLVISFLIIILVLTTMMTVTIAGYSDSIQSQDMLDAFRISADSITKRCNSYIMRVQDDMLTLAVDQTFQLHLQAFRFEGALSDSLSVPQSATSQFSVYPMRGGLLYAQTEDGTYKVAPLLQQQDWIQETIGRGGRLHLTAIEQNGTQYIRFSMLVTDMSNWTSALAVLAADVPMDSFVCTSEKITSVPPAACFYATAQLRFSIHISFLPLYRKNIFIPQLTVAPDLWRITTLSVHRSATPTGK